jgi:hypothetical protein
VPEPRHRPPHQIDAQFQLGAERRPALRRDAREALLPNVEPRQQWQGDDAPHRVPGEQPEHHPHVPVHERPAGRTGRRIVMHPGPLHLPPVPFGRGVIQSEGKPVGPGHERLHHRVSQVGGHEIGPLPGGRHRRVALPILVAQPCGPNPTRDGSPTPRQNSPDEQPRQARCRARVEGRRQSGKPVARRGERVRGWHGRFRPGRWAGVATAIVSDGPAPVYRLPITRSDTGSRGNYRTTAMKLAIPLGVAATLAAGAMLFT